MSTIENPEISKFLTEHNCRVENKRVYLSCLCDSTAIFLANMVRFLEGIGCTDIQYSGNLENDSVYGYRYEASGILPDGVDIIVVENEQT